MSKNEGNPANPVATRKLPDDFKPMMQSTLRLQVPEKDGFHRHWFRGTSERLGRAQQAYYTFVDADEVDVNNFDIGGDSLKSGSTDLGSRVSISGGGDGARMYLMECPLEFYEESQRILGERNESVAASLRGGKVGIDEKSMAYSKEKAPTLFTPNKPRRP